jgi:F0F1-type ATP synthase assembly protein I
MNSASYIFFGLLLIPLVVFLGWLLKKDKERSYLGIIVLIAMALIALFAIIKYDSKFMETGPGSRLKSQTPSYR